MRNRQDFCDEIDRLREEVRIARDEKRWAEENAAEWEARATEAECTLEEMEEDDCTDPRDWMLALVMFAAGLVLGWIAWGA
jgi:hypothetical protein